MRFLEGDVEIGAEAVLTWDGGRVQRLSAPFLRAQCPCENCRLAPLRLEPAMFPGLRLERAQPVGRYALLLGFSDGHASGAYSFDLLQSFPDKA